MTITQLMPHPHMLGMGYVVKTDSGKLLVIDGGLDDTYDCKMEGYLFDELRRISGKHRPMIEAWIFTHPHSDHFCEFIRMVRCMKEGNNQFFGVRRFYFHFPSFEYAERHFVAKDLYDMRDFRAAFNEFMCDPTAYDHYPKVCVGDTLVIDEVEIEFLSVPNENILVNCVNNHSVVFMMTVPGQKLLFLGDLGKEGGDLLAAAYGDKLKCDVVQMAHHGQCGVGENVYALANAKICLFPTPQWVWENWGAHREPGTGPFRIAETLSYPSVAKAKHIVAWQDGTKEHPLPICL